MGQFQWPDRRGGQEVVLTREPEAGFRKRIKVILLRIVPMKKSVPEHAASRVFRSRNLPGGVMGQPVSVSAGCWQMPPRWRI